MCRAKLSTAWAPALVIVMISFVYTVFLCYNLLPQLENAYASSPPAHDANDPNDHVPTKTEIMTITIVFHVLFVMLLSAFAASALTPPGDIPNTPLWKHGMFNIPAETEAFLLRMLADTSFTGKQLLEQTGFLKSMLVVERKLRNRGTARGQLRYCSACDIYKPDRTHHCRICGKCVLRMDHHCPWIANCVGFFNYKFFLLFLFYGATCCAFVLVSMAYRMYRAFRPVLSTEAFVRQDLPVAIAFVICTFLFIALFLFFCFHMNLVFSCLTTIELREKRNSGSEGVKHRWEVAHIKFDRGSTYNNFVHIFGSPWMWLLPIKSDRALTDGTYVEVEQLDPDYV